MNAFPRTLLTSMTPSDPEPDALFLAPRKILMVEDDERLSTLVRDYLAGHGFEVLIEGSGSSAVEHFVAERPSLVILDLTLPGKDGFQLCRELRALSNVPILVYTSRRDDIDHVLALELGADDFVVKSLEPRVLLARIQALLRRAGADHGAKARDPHRASGHIAVNRAARLVTYRGQKVELTAADFDLFWLLFSHQANLVTRDRLQRVLRKIPYDGVGRAIDGRIFRLRKKFQQVGAPPDLIVSVRSMGYLLAVEETGT